jgi:hypothetical protein
MVKKPQGSNNMGKSDRASPEEEEFGAKNKNKKAPAKG